MSGTTNTSVAMALPPPHVLEIWAIVLVILSTVLVMSTFIFGPTVSVIIYRIWRYPLQQPLV
uniref:Putative small membrane protein NID67-like protein n=1 Tax=Callorhinchus milii TaxID=7868 RepID=V9LAM8_CALMI